MALVVALSAAAACTPVFRNHGYVPTEQDLSQIEVGRSTRETVADTVGRPGSVGVLDAGGWYYVQSRFRHYGYRAPQEIDREIVAISFNDAGVVENVERFGLEDGRVVALSRRVTDSNIKGITFLRQLFGNLGRISAADLEN
ncbi:outer membrane protein assembly factor BamE [Mesobaculum littorinae]|uniref:Outer membrane protein assembly factor BamE n=1 Tax=Mesobaculum littorinae TaxID=2486419 RepID=A0A438AJF0_9RHOB|nr:outer membrane protein assembly factor BamE [Mesobaculum littorinae]RVV98913.1 outer membrane protein assembly factor BamE [Mesobaculum littorinae]